MIMLAKSEEKTSQDVLVYLHATSASYRGPYSWCARILRDNHTTEIGGTSLTEHDTRLTIVGMIEALNSIKEPSTITLICSNYEYAVSYVLERLDPAMEAGLRKSNVSNLELFPPLHAAVKRHIVVEGVYVDKHERDNEHLVAVAGAKQRLAALKDTSTLLPALSNGSGLSGDIHAPW